MHSFPFFTAMIADTLTIVFAVCDGNGHVDSAYEELLCMRSPTYDCELIVGTASYGPSVASSHLTILVPRMTGSQIDSKHAHGLARALTTTRQANSGGFGFFRKSRNSTSTSREKRKKAGSFYISPKDSVTRYLGPTTNMRVKWATDEHQRSALYQEALLHAAQSSEQQGLNVPRFCGYYEALTRTHPFVVVIYEDSDACSKSEPYVISFVSQCIS